MKVSDDDCQIIDAIWDRGEPVVAGTPEEEAMVEPLSAEFERPYALVSSQQRAVEPSE